MAEGIAKKQFNFGVITRGSKDSRRRNTRVFERGYIPKQAVALSGQRHSRHGYDSGHAEQLLIFGFADGGNDSPHAF
jgi:hypothetical protein